MKGWRLEFILSCFEYRHIWLNIFKDYCHLSNKTKLEKKRKRKKGSVFSLKEFLFGVKVPIIHCFFLLAKSRKLARKKKPWRIQQMVFWEFI
jgi:hypothetical protein